MMIIFFGFKASTCTTIPSTTKTVVLNDSTRLVKMPAVITEDDGREQPALQCVHEGQQEQDRRSAILVSVRRIEESAL